MVISISASGNSYNYFLIMILLILVSKKFFFRLILLCCLLFSCASSKKFDSASVRLRPFSPVAKETVPVLQVLDYKNKDEGDQMAPWLRSYLQNGTTQVEEMPVYRDSYLFIAGIYSSNLMVIQQWFKNFSTERDIPRMVAQRIRVRMDRDMVIEPNDWYGPAYESIINAAYRTSFWGGQRLDDFWVRGTQTIQNQDEEIKNTHYWGFILAAIPKDTLEIQINSLLQKTKGTGSKEQNACFEEIKGHFFDRF
jgi:hypothetical protein